MKKYLLILVVALAFVTCNEEEEFIDYSTWTVEELLTTGGGIDYLVSLTKEINYDELNERLKTEVLCYWENPVFILKKGEWTKTWMDGGGGGYMVLMEDNTFRHCFELEHQLELGKLYRTHDAGDNAVAEMIGKASPSAKIVAYVGDTLVCEYESYGIPARFLARFADCREAVLNTYTNNLKDHPETWQ